MDISQPPYPTEWLNSRLHTGWYNGHMDSSITDRYSAYIGASTPD